MENITILKTYEEVAHFDWGICPSGIIFASVTLLLIWIFYLEFIKKKNTDGAFTFCLAIAVMCIISFFSFATGKDIYETRHDVYISGMVDMTEFTEKYRVIKQDGLVFTITEVDTNEGE